MADAYSPGFEATRNFTLIDALMGRRARRFALGDKIPDGALQYESRYDPMPLSELERMMVLTAVAGNTGWINLIARNPLYAPYLSNYSGAAGGRTFPSAAGFETSEVFFTDDSGTYFFSTRDLPAQVEKDAGGMSDPEQWLQAHRSRIRKLSDGRLNLPSDVAHVEGHNFWSVNVPGSLLVIPVGDLAQHVLLCLCYYLQGGFYLYDDINSRSIPGLERYSDLYNKDWILPLTFLEQWSMSELAIELGCACYAGALMLQAMGLGGWMFDGINPFSVLGASGDPEVPGLGFRYDENESWTLPNPTGLPGVFEGFCPPHYPDMRAAVEAAAQRKFGHGGPYNPQTPGPYKDTNKVRGSALVHSEEFKDCVGLMAQYVYDTFGKFPGTVPSIFVITYLQAHHLDLEFYDTYFEPGAYLETHARHMEMWHKAESP